MTRFALVLLLLFVAVHAQGQSLPSHPSSAVCPSTMPSKSCEFLGQTIIGFKLPTVRVVNGDGYGQEIVKLQKDATVTDIEPRAGRDLCFLIDRNSHTVRAIIISTKELQLDGQYDATLMLSWLSYAQGFVAGLNTAIP